MVAQIDAHYRQAGLARQWRRLVSYALFEGRPLTTRGRWINPLVFAWLRLLAALPGQPRLDRPVFITGLGRSGTTVLGLLFSMNRDAGFLNEPKAMWHVLDPRQDINGNYSRGGGRYRLGAADVPDSDAVLRARRLFARYLACIGACRLVDKYPELIFRVDYVLKLFPDAMFVFITRDGCDAVASVVEWSQREGVRDQGGVEDWWGLNDSKWHCFRQQLLAEDARYADVAAVATATLDHTNRAALEWAVTMNEGLDRVAAHPDRVLQISYEALTGTPIETMHSLQQHLGLPLDGAVDAYATQAVYANRHKAWPVLLPPVERLFRSTMARLGYPAQAQGMRA